MISQINSLDAPTQTLTQGNEQVSQNGFWDITRRRLMGICHIGTVLIPFEIVVEFKSHIKVCRYLW